MTAIDGLAFSSFSIQSRINFVCASFQAESINRISVPNCAITPLEGTGPRFGRSLKETCRQTPSSIFSMKTSLLRCICDFSCAIAGSRDKDARMRQIQNGTNTNLGTQFFSNTEQVAIDLYPLSAVKWSHQFLPVSLCPALPTTSQHP